MNKTLHYKFYKPYKINRAYFFIPNNYFELIHDRYLTLSQICRIKFIQLGVNKKEYYKGYVSVSPIIRNNSLFCEWKRKN